MLRVQGRASTKARRIKRHKPLVIKSFSVARVKRKWKDAVGVKAGFTGPGKLHEQLSNRQVL